MTSPEEIDVQWLPRERAAHTQAMFDTSQHEEAFDMNSGQQD